MDISTRHLIELRDKRSEKAFRALFDIYSGKLNGYLQMRGLSPQASEDIVQDVFIAIWRKSSQFDPSRANASAWVYQIARNKMIDHLRQEPMPVPEELVAMTVDDTQVDQSLLQVEVEKLRAALAQLAPEQRAMIEKSFLQEQSHSEIMTQTELPLGTIKSRIRLGIEKLRHNMQVQKK